jgi:DNA-binding IclR family transcriptional regulator
LAFLPPRTLKRLFNLHDAEIAAVHLGSSWSEFRATLRALRKPRYVLAHAEVDRGRFGIAAPILNRNRTAIASLSYVLSDTKADDRTINRLASIITTAAREVEVALGNAAVQKVSPRVEDTAAVITEDSVLL